MAPKQKSNRMCSKDVCASYKNEIENPSNVGFTPTLTKNLMSVKFGKRQEKCLLDTGAAISAISKSLLDQVAPEAKIKRSSLISIRGVCGEIHQVLGNLIHGTSVQYLIIYCCCRLTLIGLERNGPVKLHSTSKRM